MRISRYRYAQSKQAGTARNKENVMTVLSPLTKNNVASAAAGRGLSLAFIGLALLSACGGGGGDGGGSIVPPPVVLRPPVEMETLNLTSRDTYRDKAGTSYAHVCPGVDDRQGPRSFLVDVSGFAPDRIDEQPADGELEAVCAGHSTNANYHLVQSWWVNGGDYVQRNAGALRMLIETMIDTYEINADDKLAIVGYSMGGLVSRYALQSMETEGVRHHVDLFVSVDSPQQGAYVPIGTQHLVKLFEDYGAGKMLAEVDSPAARQMLIYHYRQGNNTQTWTDDFQALYFDELDGALGGFLLDDSVRTVGVSSGRTGGGTETPRPGQTYYKGTRNESRTFTHSTSGCSRSLSYNVDVDVTINASALSLGLQPNNSFVSQLPRALVAYSSVQTTLDGIDIDDEDELVTHFQALTRAQLPIYCDPFVTRNMIRPIVQDIVTDNRSEADQFDNKTFWATPNGSLSDGVAGGQSHVIGELKSELSKNGFRLGVLDVSVRDQVTNVFIPFGSALMLSGLDPLRNYDEATLEAASAFDKIYFEQAENLYHLESTSGWFEAEVLSLFEG